MKEIRKGREPHSDVLEAEKRVQNQLLQESLIKKNSPRRARGSTVQMTQVTK